MFNTLISTHNKCLMKVWWSYFIIVNFSYVLYEELHLSALLMNFYAGRRKYSKSKLEFFSLFSSSKFIISTLKNHFFFVICKYFKMFWYKNMNMSCSKYCLISCTDSFSFSTFHFSCAIFLIHFKIFLYVTSYQLCF